MNHKTIAMGPIALSEGDSMQKRSGKLVGTDDSPSETGRPANQPEHWAYILREVTNSDWEK